ncbi:hypothetical protein L6452_17675 [Arctium lappa]|uniref:Uncharacterized protein n=1 Tax=Arctium lappa TaxID=4217 RepID=A0ACB9C424_ARCLA|nr:hypothetical protein L6452_17675 [Arctium lappa]
MRKRKHIRVSEFTRNSYLHTAEQHFAQIKFCNFHDIEVQAIVVRCFPSEEQEHVSGVITKQDKMPYHLNLVELLRGQRRTNFGESDRPTGNDNWIEIEGLIIQRVVVQIHDGTAAIKTMLTSPIIEKFLTMTSTQIRNAEEAGENIQSIADKELNGQAIVAFARAYDAST